MRAAPSPIRRKPPGALQGSGSGALVPAHAIFTHDSFSGCLFFGRIAVCVAHLLSQGSSFHAVEGPLSSHADLIQLANFVHDIFLQSPDTHQVILKGSDHSLLCKRMGSKEVYVLQQPSSGCFDADIEVKKFLIGSEEFGIKIL